MIETVNTTKERVEVEQKELLQKWDSLGVFIHSDKFKTYVLAQQRLLKEQYRTMKKYIEILGARLSIWEG